MKKQSLFTRNFTVLLLGQACSLLGNFTLKFALSMYVLEQTGSASVFAGLLALAMVPTIILSPFGGMLADRVNRRNLMVCLDALSGAAVLLAGFWLFRGNDMVVIGTLLVALSILGAFESPTVQACVPQMHQGENLLKGNAVVNQIAAVAGLVTPFLGSLFYTAFGIRPVLYTAVCCFFITAVFECFLRLDFHKPERKMRVGAMVREDFTASMRFLCREQTSVLKLLLLAALVSLFVAGTAVVGFPYLVRTVLGLSAEYYGAAESALGLAAILGSLSVGLLANRIRLNRLYLFLLGFGACLIPAGVAFLLPVGAVPKYLILVAAFCIGQAVCSIFSIVALSAIQARTPQHLTGKVMAYVATISMCAQPLGQVVYGALFDACSDCVYWVLLPSGAAVCAIGLWSARFFQKLKAEEEAVERP